MTAGIFVTSVNMSERTGTVKRAVPEVTMDARGIVGDAHAGDWHRQVSLLAIESIDKMRKLGFNVGPGDFAENLTTEGIALVSLPVGTRLSVGDVILEISQIGKECHSGCAIMRQTGKCIMPKEGIFAKVIHGGQVKAGDTINLSETRES